MGIDLCTNESSLAIVEETTEGTYAPEASGADFIEVEAGAAFALSREQLDRNVLTDTVEKIKSRVGAKDVTFNFKTELKAGDAEGEAPRSDVAWRALLGGQRQLLAAITSDTGHTTTNIKIADADFAKLEVGDVVTIKEAGAFWITAVEAIDETPGSGNFDIFPAMPSAPSDNVEISKHTTYFHNSDDLITFSSTYYHGGEVRDKIDGCRCNTGTVEDWESGQLPNITFAGDALDKDKEVGQPLFTPSYPTSLPPILLKACAFLKFEDGTEQELQYSSFALTIENELVKKASACAESGYIGTKVTALTVSGSINPYMEDDDTERFDALNLNKDFKLFIRAYNETDSAGEFEQGVGIYLPQSVITEMPAEDLDGNIVDNISFSSHKDLGNDTIFVGFN